MRAWERKEGRKEGGRGGVSKNHDKKVFLIQIKEGRKEGEEKKGGEGMQGGEGRKEDTKVVLITTKEGGKDEEEGRMEGGGGRARVRRKGGG